MRNVPQAVDYLRDRLLVALYLFDQVHSPHFEPWHSQDTYLIKGYAVTYKMSTT